LRVGFATRVIGEETCERIVLRAHFVGFLVEPCAHAFEHLHERRRTVARRLRKISPREERHQILRRQEHSQRPAAAAPRESLMRELVDLVDIWPLFAIDLDIDVQRVHHARGCFVFEAFVRHDVAPVAGGVADREQDRLVRRARGGERLVGPRPPVDRIVRVLAKIRAGFARESVRHAHRYPGSKRVYSLVSLVAPAASRYRARP